MGNKEKVRHRKIKFILIYILILNWLVALVKIIYGLFSRCSSITADGFHSLSDGASNIIGLIGINLASQPKDRDHHYGHKKYETFFSLGIGLLLLILSFNLLKEGVGRLYSPVFPLLDTKSFAVILTTLLINLVVMRYEYKKGKLLQSDILTSDASHTKADIFTSLSVIVAIIFIKSGYPVMDGIVTIIISFFIAYSGFQIIREGSNILCDKASVDIHRISEIVLEIKGVKTCHNIRARGRSDDIYVDLHVQVEPQMHIDKAHLLSFQIEEAIKKGIPGVTDVVVHIEPAKPHLNTTP